MDENKPQSGWELAFTLLDKLDLIQRNIAAVLGISIHPS